MAASKTLKQFILELEDKRFVQLLDLFNRTVTEKALLPQDLSLDDLRNLDRNDLLELTPAYLQLKIKLLINTKLDKYFDGKIDLRPPGQIVAKQAIVHPRQDDVMFIPKQLYLVGKICSYCIQSSWFKRDKYLADINDLARIDFTDLSQLQLINLAECPLRDADMPYLINACREFIERKLPLQYLILANNYLNKSHDHIIELIDMGITVNIVMTNAATTEYTEWFNNLAVKYLTKLIWIPKIWLNGDSWMKVLQNEELNTLVKATHDNYYEYYPNPACMEWIDYNF